MISVEQWRARIGLFGTKRYSGCRSSLFSSYVPFTFRRGRRDRSTSAQQEPPTEEPPSQHASQPQVNVPGNLNTNPFPPAEKQSVVSLKDEKSWSLSSNFSRCFTSFLYTGLLKSSLLREALIRSVLLMATISQLLITSGDIEENPGPDPSIANLMTHVARKTPTKWYEVGIQLNIEIATLQAFQQQTGDPMVLYSYVFNQWKKEDIMPFTWDTIINALENVGENGTVKEVREWLSTCSSSSTTLSALPANDLHTKLSSEEQHEMTTMGDRDQIISYQKLEGELRAIHKEKLEYQKKCKEHEEKCKELVEMLEQKAAIRNSAVSEVGVQVPSDEKAQSLVVLYISHMSCVGQSSCESHTFLPSTMWSVDDVCILIDGGDLVQQAERELDLVQLPEDPKKTTGACAFIKICIFIIRRTVTVAFLDMINMSSHRSTIW